MKTSLWRNTKIQCVRLVAELDRIGLTTNQIVKLCSEEHMNIDIEALTDLLDRSHEEFEKIKAKL